MAISAAEAFTITDAQDRITHRIFSSGLALASIVSSQPVDDDIALRLLDVIDGLDAVMREIRSPALGLLVANRDEALLEVLHPETERAEASRS